MKSYLLRKALLLPAITVAGAIAFALPASVAFAQDSQTPKTENSSAESGAPAPAPGSVGGVVVQAPGRSSLQRIPPDEEAAFDQEVAKAEAWKRYRRSIPPLAAGTLAQARGYPGLQTLLGY